MRRLVPAMTALALGLLALAGCGDEAPTPTVAPAVTRAPLATVTRAPAAAMPAPATGVPAPVASSVGSPVLPPPGASPTAPAITNPTSVVFADTIEFLGYDLAPYGRTAEGAVFSMTYYWRAIVAPPTDYQVFVHVTTPAGDQIVAGNDHDPAQTAPPTSRWQPGAVVRVGTRLFVPHTVPPGAYPLRVGLHVPGVTIVPVTRVPAGATEGTALGVRVGTVQHMT